MRALLFGAASLFVVACSRPAPPTLTPKQAVVTSVTPAALGLDLTLDATNPNAVDLTALTSQPDLLSGVDDAELDDELDGDEFDDDAQA